MACAQVLELKLLPQPQLEVVSTINRVYSLLQHLHYTNCSSNPAPVGTLQFRAVTEKLPVALKYPDIGLCLLPINKPGLQNSGCLVPPSPNPTS